MAGDIQEPFRLSFQADSFHSGSISFGRFETEALCWERRSSFSHNRYLEEVEKCSKPGSVTEKKAYFEAHFRRKGLLSQNSSERQSVIACQNSENENLQNMDCEVDIENLNEHGNMTSYGESSGHSVHEKDFETTDYELDCSGNSYSYYLEGEHAFDNANDADIIREHVMGEEACQAGGGNSPPRTTEPEDDVKQNHNGDGEATTSDMSSKSGRLAGSPMAEKEVSSKQEQGPPSKAKVGAHAKRVESKWTPSQPSFVRTKKNMSREGSNASNKKPAKREIGVSMRSRKEKQLSESSASASTVNSALKTLKPEVSQSSKKKLHEIKSNAKESTTKKAVISRPSTAEKFAPRAHQNASRSMRAVNSTKQFIKQNGSAFCFKSDERAERRKEFNMKLEIKMHARETKIQEVQAKKQEKIEVDIKQLRKSLNFKATPMPSFYTAAGQRSNKNKVLASNSKSSPVHNRPSSPAIAATEGSPSFSNVGNGQAGFTTEFIKTTGSLQVSGVISYPSAVHSEGKVQFLDLAASDCHSNTSAADKGLAVKEEQEKVKHTTLQKQRASEGNKVSKGQKIEDKHKGEAERRMKGVMRKDIKGVDLRSSSRISNLAVGVAS